MRAWSLGGIALVLAAGRQLVSTPSTGVVEGVVVEEATDRPLSGVRFTVDGVPSPDSSTAEGRFQLVNLAAGGRLIEVRLPGYRTARIQVTLAEQQRMFLEVGLEVADGR